MAPIVPSPSSEPAADRAKRMQWWNDAHFGMFIHYGLYSGLEGDLDGKPVNDVCVEWFQEWTGMDSESYEKLATPKFVPKPDAAKIWADLAKTAGAEYVVLTTKHHEGFGLFESKQGNFTSHSLIGRDIVAEYSEALRAQGLKVGFYHSLIDWKHPDYNSASDSSMPMPKNELERTKGHSRDHSRYLEYLHGQVGELMGNYGPVDILWFDFSHENFEGVEAWKSDELMAKVRQAQPDIIVNNRMYRRPAAGFSGDGLDEISPQIDPRYGDFLTPEQFVPASGMPGVAWESCLTLNKTWGYSRFDHDYKSSTELIRNLSGVVSKGGNFLLNVGPKGDGTLSAETVDRFEAIGRWMAVNGEAIKGTTGSPFETAFDWGVATAKPGLVYLHVFELPESGSISAPLSSIKSAHFLGGPEVEFSEGTFKINALPDEAVSVIKVELL